jgi:hypothetical protein
MYANGPEDLAAAWPLEGRCEILVQEYCAGAGHGIGMLRRKAASRRRSNTAASMSSRSREGSARWGERGARSRAAGLRLTLLAAVD